MLKKEIKHYRDKNGYINSKVVNITAGRQGNNSLCYSSEYFIMLEKRHEDHSLDADEWEILINKSSLAPGLLVAYPGDNTPITLEDQYGVLAAASVLNKPRVALDMFHRRKFQFHHPELIFSMLCASTTYKWYKFWYWPLAIYTAFVIYSSCLDTPTQNTKARRLSWLLIQAVSKNSWLCRRASKFWYARLYKDYGNSGMRAVAKIYYQQAHPFSTYWVD